MCGIAGAFSIDGAGVDPGQLRAMAEALRHRGPDDEGYLLVDGSGSVEERRGPDTVLERGVGLRHVCQESETRYMLGLAHRRLSIIDVSAAGHQPMASPDGRLWLVYNGEVYNYVELRRELEALGYRFHSDSDSEVVLRAYEHWGERCLDRFNGMWAFALADLRRGRLFCARDRLGVKPFYYWFDGTRFAFASEIKALLRLPFVGRTPNERLVWEFLVLGALDHTDETFVAGIHALGAGQQLVLSFDGQLRRRTYWNVPVHELRDETGRPAARDQVEQVRELLIDAVRLRLRSDVSVGFCLSGGLDSSSIVGIADRLLDETHRPQVGERLKVFHSAFDDPAIDEREYVRAVVGQTRATPFYVFPSSAELVEDFERLVWHQDEPFGGPSVYAQYRVVRRAREAGVKVLLDGQGGDELFGGYYRYAGAMWLQLLSARRFDRALAALTTNASVIGRHALLRLALRSLPIPLARGVLLRSTTTAGLLDPDFRTAHAEQADRFLDETRASGTVAQMLALDLTRRSLPRLLRFEDRNSMAFSLESRVPFVDDPRLIELVCSLPDSAKIWHGWSKYILRQAMGGILPEVVRWRKRKLGFSVPEHRWAREVGVERVRELLADIPGQYVNRRELERPRAARLTSRAGVDMLWRLLELAIWERALSASPQPGRRPRPGLATAAS